MKLVYKSPLSKNLEESVDLAKVSIEFEDPGYTMRLTVEEFFVHLRDRIMELEVKVQELEQRNEKK